MSAPEAPDISGVALLQMARRLALFHLRAGMAADDYKSMQSAAQLTFAEIRARGIPNQEVRLPDGTKVAVISIEQGPVSVDIDEDALLTIAAVNDYRDIEDYVTAGALADKRVIRLIREHYPELVGRRVEAYALARYKKEIEENGGRVIDRSTGERVPVATVTRREATGQFAMRFTSKGRVLLQEAADAGLINDRGEADGEAPEAFPPQGGAPAAEVPQPAGEAAPAAPAPAAAAAASPARPGGRPAAHPPTGEQQAVMDAAQSGGNLVIEAGAGAGKTSTLKLASSVLGGRGYYLAFNRSVAQEAAREFPAHVNCSTAHSLAFAAAGRPYAHRLAGPRIPARETARILGITGPLRAGADRVLAPHQLARLVMETVSQYAHSADPEISEAHVPRQSGLDSDEAMAVLRAELPPLARRAWADLSSTEGTLKFDHDVYLKLYQLSGPQLDADFIFLDEAQDSDPVVLDIVTSQRGAQLIAVGDRAQQIYEWRGAVDAMDKFPGAARLPLSMSFRFGAAVAAEANKWLAVLGSGMRLAGNPARASAVAALPESRAVLCRTNGGALGQAMQVMDAGRKAAIVGGGKQIRALAEAAEALKAGRPTSHPELWAFQSWSEVQDYVEHDAGGSDLRVMVQLIDEKGTEVIKAVCDQLADERDADTVVSTVHKAKGLEWDTVRIAGDFREPRKDPERTGEDPEIPAADARLAYVAVTRARLGLDPAGVAWVRKYLRAAAA